MPLKAQRTAIIDAWSSMTVLFVGGNGTLRVGPPQNFVNTQLSTSSLRCTWEASVNTGPGITGYKVYQQLGGSPNPSTDTLKATLGVVLTTDITGLSSDTLYTFYAVAIGGNGLDSDPSNADGAMTVSGSQFNTHSTTSTPYLPWAAGWGSDTKGGTGRDAPSGGLGASTNVYIIDSNSDYLTALGANQRRVCFIVKSGLYDFGADQYVDIYGQCTVVDVSPSPGAVIKGVVHVLRGEDICFLNMDVRTKTENAAEAVLNCNFGHFHSSVVLRRNWFAHCNMLYPTDQSFTFYYTSENCGLFACTLLRPIATGSTHPEGRHNTGVITAWYGESNDFGVYRSVYDGATNRCPMLGATVDGQYCDNLIFNWSDAALQVGQKMDVFTSGYPTRSNVETNLCKQGLDMFVDSGNPPIQVGGHAGTTVFLSGNRYIGATYNDTTMLQIDGSVVTQVGSRISSAIGNGYTTTPFGSTTQAKADRVELLCESAGARPDDRNPAIQTILDSIIDGTGRWQAEGAQNFSSGLAQNTRDISASGDAFPGVTSNTFSQTLGNAGRTISGSYTALEAKIHTELASMGCGG